MVKPINQCCRFQSMTCDFPLKYAVCKGGVRAEAEFRNRGNLRKVIKHKPRCPKLSRACHFAPVVQGLCEVAEGHKFWQALDRVFVAGGKFASVMRAFLAGLALSAVPSIARANAGPVDLSAVVTVDVASVIAGEGDARLRALTNINVMADNDLAALAGWQGARVFVYVLDNRGGRPNDAPGTLQGVDNIEVPNAGLCLFEAWIKQDLGGGANLRAGLYGRNSEFYNIESAGVLLIAGAGKIEGPLRGSVGVWHYSRNPHDIYDAGPDGKPLRKPAQGTYVVVEGDLLSGKAR